MSSNDQNLSVPLAPDRADPRLDRITRLLGEPAMDRLARAHVAVFGVGGVGSFTAEALARSGVGRLTLIDGERVCVTNINRQLHATEATLGRPKVEAMAERLRLIHPEARVDEVHEHYVADNAERMLPSGGFDYVVDAIDTVTSKLNLLARCLTLGLPVVSSMGAAGRLDPTKVRVTDLAETQGDPFAADVRKYLRMRYDIRRNPFGITAVWSTEKPLTGLSLKGDEAGLPGVRAAEPGKRAPKCLGSAAFVTGVFGMTVASVVVRALAGEREAPGS